jgi:hypothetical protein
MAEAVQFQLLKSLKRRVDLDKLDLSYLLTKEDIEREAKFLPSYEKSLRQQVFGDIKKDGRFSAVFDVVETRHRRVLGFLARNKVSFAVSEDLKGLTPLLWACHMRHLPTIKALVEEANVPLSKPDLAISILRSTEGGWVYST